MIALYEAYCRERGINRTLLLQRILEARIRNGLPLRLN